MNTKGYIICLCDLTGTMAAPWVADGYTAILVDPQHEAAMITDSWITLPFTIVEAMPFLSLIAASGLVKAVFGFPPCTDVAVSGARWWEEKRKADPYFQAKAAIVAEQCRTIGVMCGSEWCFENPVSAFSGIFGPPDYTFDPHDFNYLAEDTSDNYTKMTCLWGSPTFPWPKKGLYDYSLGEPDDRIFKAAPGEDRANFRSATPKGFALAVRQAFKAKYGW